MCIFFVTADTSSSNSSKARKRKEMFEQIREHGDPLLSPVFGTNLVSSPDQRIPLMRPSRLAPMFELPGPTGRRVTLRTAPKNVSDHNRRKEDDCWVYCHDAICSEHMPSLCLVSACVQSTISSQARESMCCQSHRLDLWIFESSCVLCDLSSLLCSHVARTVTQTPFPSFSRMHPHTILLSPRARHWMLATGITVITLVVLLVAFILFVFVNRVLYSPWTVSGNLVVSGSDSKSRGLSIAGDNSGASMAFLRLDPSSVPDSVTVVSSRSAGRTVVRDSSTDAFVNNTRCASSSLYDAILRGSIA